MQATIASSELVVGRNRFTFGLIDDDRPLTVPTARVTFFSLKRTGATRLFSLTARFNYFARGLPHTAANAQAYEIKGVYVTYPHFTHAGTWGAEFDVRYRGKNWTIRESFTVDAHSSTPAVGTPAPRTNNPTIAQEPATKLDSGRPPDDMHKLSIATVLKQHRPLVVLFATAAYCTSRMCGPQIEIVEGLEHRFRSKVAFIHIEIYKNANPQDGFAPAVLQWHLQTEPWVFVINRAGVIIAKFEGPTTAGEITPAIEQAIHSKP